MNGWNFVWLDSRVGVYEWEVNRLVWKGILVDGVWCPRFGLDMSFEDDNYGSSRRRAGGSYRVCAACLCRLLYIFFIVFNRMKLQDIYDLEYWTFAHSSFWIHLIASVILSSSIRHLTYMDLVMKTSQC
ncbi:hypothetical protein TWF481_007572 [Arthrobotrys musiformis]|uniref:Transmembrane protein n=1 Tax=Arthrobotrys musiformis TaxID=47236 RepID=A0AAV9WE58_9PEZI